jgi:hypothetical protein
MGNKKLWALALLTCAFLPWADVCAQSTGTWIEFGNLRLTLGLSRDGVLGKLAQEYRIDQLYEGGYFVTTKDEPRSIIGTVRFRNGRLVSVYRYWGPGPRGERQGVDLAQSFYGLARVFAQEGRTACRLKVSEHESPDGEDRLVIIRCGDKSIDVHIAHTAGHREFVVANVEESLETE